MNDYAFGFLIFCIIFFATIAARLTVDVIGERSAALERIASETIMKRECLQWKTPR